MHPRLQAVIKKLKKRGHKNTEHSQISYIIMKKELPNITFSQICEFTFFFLSTM